MAFIISAKRTFWMSIREHKKHLPISVVDLGLLD
jgi:hypothetical protein